MIRRLTLDYIDLLNYNLAIIRKLINRELIKSVSSPSTMLTNSLRFGQVN